MINITEHVCTERLKDSLAQVYPHTHEVNLWWLGQAGFALKYADTLLLIDPYLSDFLAKKYQGKEFPHIRMMDAPILPEEVEHVRLVLCTHRHSDHIDPEALPIIAKNNQECVFVAPRADREWVIHLVGAARRVHTINAGERIEFAQDIVVEAIPAAHEELQVNVQGEHVFLGYIVKFGGITIYHSGDCTPYAGLEEALAAHPIDLALLPVNGRDEYRRDRGILGNFTLAEAVSLGKQANIPFLLGHHFGMFDFNTINVEQAEHELQSLRGDKQYTLVKHGVKYILSS